MQGVVLNGESLIGRRECGTEILSRIKIPIYYRLVKNPQRHRILSHTVRDRPYTVAPLYAPS